MQSAPKQQSQLANDISFSCVWPVIDRKFRHNIVKVAVDPQTTWSML